MTSPKTQSITAPTKTKDVIVVEAHAEKSTDSKDRKKDPEKKSPASKTVEEEEEEEEILYDLTEDLLPIRS